MGSKKNRNRAAPTPVAQPQSKGAPWPLIAVVAVALAGGGVYMATSSGGDDAPVASAPASQTAANTPASAPASADAAPAAATPAAAPQSTTAAREPLPDDLPMPPLPYVPSAAAGPPELMQQAYVFAAKNPHILDYVPCYCGCGSTAGHVGNTDCFVQRRAPNGAVEAWDTHGLT
ncbi:MAG: hypothetical protein CL928_06280 [Deltaproteobacteria bacterium]|nr:hypothetical protein [Deltaproteobacteria bacterium]